MIKPIEFLSGATKTDDAVTGHWGKALEGATGWSIYARSITLRDQSILFLGREKGAKTLGIVYQGASEVADAFAGEASAVDLDGKQVTLKACPLTHENALALRAALPYTGPMVVGLATSGGCGDRLGLATPGHIHAIRGTGLVPFLAQQSIREMERSGRTPDDVMDDASWAVLQEGWRQGFGSDADHLKTTEDIDICVAAGFTLYTIDPREHVDNDAHTDPAEVLEKKYAQLPWANLETTPEAMAETYLGKDFPLEDDLTITLSQEQLWRAAGKYGRAIVHVVGMYRYLMAAMKNEPFELEVSVDETDTPTAPHEHYFVANELLRMGLRWSSLAPRYLGRFEKGVDYIGDLDAFSEDLRWHAAIARKLGPYKLSIHSGSDKFTIYPIFAEHCGSLVHLKTAGTSYLEALRATADLDPALFREILGFAFDHYEEDKASYHVSADINKVKRPDELADDKLAGVLDIFDGRQLLHVTFGSVLTETVADGSYLFRDRLLSVLDANEDAHYDVIEAHFDRHFAPF
jgi:tagaturonate epimerase